MNENSKKIGGGAVTTTRQPRAVFDYAQWEAFVRKWQASPTIEAAAAGVGLTVVQARVKAACLRKLGVDLRKFARSRSVRLSSSEIARLKTLSRQVIAAGTIVAPKLGRDDD